MPTGTFQSGDVRIAYDDVGSGPPVVLVHGFASGRVTNWRGTGWYDALTEAGRRVLALDLRGHGESDAPHDPAAYGIETMVGDVVALLDHCGISEATFVGYSLGSRIVGRLLLDHPDRVTAVVLGGMGSTMLDGWDRGDAIAAALEADDIEDVTDPSVRHFRAFAERRGSDLQALAALQRAPQSPEDRAALAAVERPVLVVIGEHDEMVGDLAPLLDAIPGAESVVVPDRDHLTTVGDRRFRDAVVDFLDRVDG